MAHNEKQRQFRRLQVRLSHAVYGIDSVINGACIHNLLAEMEALADDDLQDDLDAARALVERWRQMWLPTDSAS